MKRIQAACIMQTLVFSQKEELGLSREKALSLNQAEFQHYKDTMEKTRTRYQIQDVQEREDGAILVRVRKQYNAKVVQDTRATIVGVYKHCFCVEECTTGTPQRHTFTYADLLTRRVDVLPDE